jgi:flagellar basal body-associated protein FliL
VKLLVCISGGNREEFTDYFTSFPDALERYKLYPMSKLDDLKAKLAALQQTLSEKLDKIPLLKKLLAKSSAPTAAPAAPKSYAPSPTSIGQIYKGGGTLTRLQVFVFYIFVIAMVVSGTLAGKKLFQRFRTSPEHEKMVADVSHGLGDIKRRMEENATVLSLGKFTVNAFVDQHHQTRMSIDLWLRVSSVDAANFVQSHEEVLHDKTMDALNELFMNQVNLLTEPGKVQARKTLIKFLNAALPKGEVQEIFFYNMVAQ